MSFLEDCRAVRGGYNGIDAWSVANEIDSVEIVEDDIVDEGRWVTVHFAVLRRGDEFVGLEYERPATELQEGGDFDHEFYSVKPYEVTVTKYRRVSETAPQTHYDDGVPF